MPAENTGYEIKHIHHGKGAMKEQGKGKESRTKHIKKTEKQIFFYPL